MKRSLLAATILTCIVLAIAVILPAAVTVQAGNDKTANPADAALSKGALSQADLSKAEAYCVKKGGEVNDRDPYYNTNGDEQDWLRLSGWRQFCKFKSNKDGSRIYVELSTLYTEKPTLAALAYYAEVPITGSCNGNQCCWWRMGQEIRSRRHRARSLHFPRHVDDRFLGTYISLCRNHSRQEPGQRAAL